MRGDHIRKGLLGLFFVALLATPLVVKQMSTRNDSRFAADAKATALERHGFYFEEVARAAGIDFVHRAPTLDPQLAPIMPYGFYKVFTDRDLDAVVAYLRSVPAVSNKVAPPVYKAALHVEIPPGAEKQMTAANMTDAARRGFYLATIGHCMECHSPEVNNRLDFANLGKGGRQFKGPWGIPDKVGGTTDVENSAHGFVTFKSGQVLSLQVSWAEMIQREEVSVNFQGTKAGGRVQRLFAVDGIDSTAIDSCELYVQENGHSVNRSISTPACEDMGRIGSAANFIEFLEGKAEPLNTPEQALRLMQVIDAVYASAKTGKPVSI